jgi:hypothetical protein
MQKSCLEHSFSNLTCIGHWTSFQNVLKIHDFGPRYFQNKSIHLFKSKKVENIGQLLLVKLCPMCCRETTFGLNLYLAENLMWLLGRV